MNTYPADFTVDVDVVFNDLNGAPVVPTAVNAKLYDDDDLLVTDFGSVSFAPGDIHVGITILPAFNALADGVTQAARILRVDLVTTAGTVHLSTAYLIAGQFRLQLMTNSFVSMEAADLIAAGMVNLIGWNKASEDQRYAALIESYNRLLLVPMRFTYPPDHPLLPNQEVIIERAGWPNVTAEQFLDCPKPFRTALRRAQLNQASELLQGDAYGRKFRAGIASEKIGESSVTLRNNIIASSVSATTLALLAGFIYYSNRIARA